MVTELNGLSIHFTGDLPTLIVQNIDQPGHVSDVAGILAREDVNIASMHVYRNRPGGNAVMIIETDKSVPHEAIEKLSHFEGILRVIFIDGDQNKPA